MKKESAEIGPKATQETVAKIINITGQIAEKGGKILDPSWHDCAGRINPNKFFGYDFFIACRLTMEAEYYFPELPLALVHLSKTENFGTIETKYKIIKEDDLLKIDRYDTASTHSDEERRELVKSVSRLIQEDPEGAKEKMDEFLQKREEIQQDERQFGLSFVSENEATFLAELLEKINSEHTFY